MFTRANGVWTQQAPKLVGSGSVPNPFQGHSVALSADGNTLLVGGSFDNFFRGAAWIFTRANGVWSQQGPKLVGTGMSGFLEQGMSSAISADGNTALLGANHPDGVCGFTRTNGVWAQQGACTLADVGQGSSVALSADGSTAVLDDYNNATGGAARVLVRSSGQWLQIGDKLVGSGATGNAGQGSRVAVSGDGKTVILGHAADNQEVGAAWVFTAAAPKAIPSLSTGTDTNPAVYAAQPRFTVHVIGNAELPLVGPNVRFNQ